MITIIDYGSGNLRSIQSKINREGIKTVISDNKDILENATVLILAGVGHFGTGMHNLEEKGLINVLNECVLERKIPIFGICLGMQLFTMRSEEGNVKGLGWIDALTRKFDFEGLDSKLRVPHVGWCGLNKHKDNSCLKDIERDQKFYFTHSYYVKCNNPENVIATTDYGIKFDSIISYGNIFGTQFHPEKSHKRGLKLLINFIRYYAQK